MLNSSPFTKNKQSLSGLMTSVAWALLPGFIALFYFFGWGVVFNVVTCAVTCVLTEAAVLHLRKKPFIILKDYSALLTGVLLGLALPPLAPWWIAVIGSSFAILFAKQIYGGLGFNPFNPAMAGYVLLLISFPVAMTAWLPPQALAENNASFIDSLYIFLFSFDTHQHTLAYYRLGVDGFTMATPLDQLKTSKTMGYLISEVTNKAIFSDIVNVGWQWVNAGFLLGGIYLLVKKHIHYAIPVGVLVGLLFPALIFNGYSPDEYPSLIVHAFSGATMLGAFFIATDPVSAATTYKGRLIFGFGVGLITWLIRTFGGYPDAFAFAVLLMNMAVPLIDHFTQPTVYGYKTSPSQNEELNS